METAVIDNISNDTNVFEVIAPDSPASIITVSEPFDDEEDLFIESVDDFSTQPVVFEEATARLLNKVEELFDLSARFNRHVPQYLECCSRLEKGIKSLGTAALTKAALELRKYEFPLLDQLSTQKLYGMVSFNYRKLDDALSAAISKKNDSVYKLFEMQCRFYHLLDRLKATEAKIYNIQNGMVSENEIVGRALMLSKESWNGWRTKEHTKPSVFRKTTAFPLNYNAIRESEWQFIKKDSTKVHPSHTEKPVFFEEFIQQKQKSDKPQSADDHPSEEPMPEWLSKSCQSIRQKSASGDSDEITFGDVLAEAEIPAADKWSRIFSLQNTKGSPPGRV